MTQPATETLMHQEAGAAAALVARQLQANAALLETLAAPLRARPPRFVVTLARGSSDHAAAFGKYLFETRLGLATASASPAVASVYGCEQRLQGALVLAVSQSGRSPDLLKAAQAARRGGAHLLALVNDTASPLAQRADGVLPLHAGPELSVAATKSYLCTLTALLQLVQVLRPDPLLAAALQALPGQMEQAFAADWSPLADGLRAATNLFVVGRGYGYGVALEAALKLKETCGLHAEAISAAEVRHGPMALVGPGFPVLFFTQPDDTLEGTLAVVRDFHARGARVWLAAPGCTLPAGTPGLLPMPLPEPASALTAPLLAATAFYRAACQLSLARGFDPDLPPHLRKVTETL